jgi:hypothetical protein
VIFASQIEIKSKFLDVTKFSNKAFVDARVGGKLFSVAHAVSPPGKCYGGLTGLTRRRVESTCPHSDVAATSPRPSGEAQGCVGRPEATARGFPGVAGHPH